MRDSSTKDKVIETVFKTFLDNVGLSKDAAVFVHENHTTLNREFTLTIGFKVGSEAILNTNMPFMTFLQNLQSRILESNLVKQEIKKMQDKLDMANRSSDELLKRVEELEKYKIYYVMACELAHGKEQIMIDGTCRR